MAISTSTPIFCDNGTTQLCYTATDNFANHFNSQEKDFQLNSLITQISLATIIFFLVAFFIYNLMIKK